MRPTHTVPSLLRTLPKTRMPADLRAAIERQTIGRESLWSRLFSLRVWMPPVLAFATAAGAWMLTKHSSAAPELPVALSPVPAVTVPDHPRLAMHHSSSSEDNTNCQDVPQGC